MTGRSEQGVTTEEIKRRARELGLTHAGVARATRLGPEEEHLAEWLHRGYAASMGWMARRAAERVDPRRVLPGARSVIVVGMNYYTQHRHGTTAGKISRYAWGDDYHDILGGRVQALDTWLHDRQPGLRSRWYVDTGPVMEKAWAQRAGIGWLGKNGTVITPDKGSWVFLGVILVDSELSSDAPATDQCGTCTLCLESCPTGAIVEPMVVNAQDCIAYQTIEHRGEFSGGAEGRLAGWLFGCDICQDVCPWNQKHARPTEVRGFEPRPELLTPDVAALAVQSDESFATLFAGSPVLRARPEGLRRNARAVLGQGHAPSAGDPPPQVSASHP